MFRKSVAAAVLFAGAAFLPTAAQAASGYTVERTEMRAGPDFDYPAVRDIGGDRRVEIYGCLNDWSFCDVGYRSDRGWVPGEDIVADYRGRRTRIIDSGPYVGIGFLSFSFGSYWDNHYRGRPFYRERGRWERHYHDHYKSNWGPRRDNDRRDWNDRDRRDGRDWNDRDRRDNDRRDNDRPGNNNDRRDGDRNRTDNDRRDNDNNASYRGKPTPPAVAPANPQPGFGLNERNGRNENNRPDGNRSNDRRESRPEPAKPQVAPTPQVMPAAPKPSMDNNRNDRPGGGERPGAGERRDGGQRPDAGERRERPRDNPGQERQDRSPKPEKAPAKPDDEDKRPGR